MRKYFSTRTRTIGRTSFDKNLSALFGKDGLQLEASMAASAKNKAYVLMKNDITDSAFEETLSASQSEASYRRVKLRTYSKATPFRNDQREEGLQVDQESYRYPVSALVQHSGMGSWNFGYAWFGGP